jgi:hypothetical protein
VKIDSKNARVGMLFFFFSLLVAVEIDGRNERDRRRQ